MILHSIKSYLKFLWNSKNQHGVHSPFVYNLLTKCFYNKTNYQEYSILKSNHKSANYPISSKQVNLLFRVVHYFQPKSILEIGSSLESATSVFSLGHKNAIISSQNSSSEFYDLIFFGGNSSKKEVLEYFEMLMPTCTNDSVWIINAIHGSKDMEDTWEIIKNHPKVTVTIDTFYLGFVFFRSEQKKEHFVIRA
jgi:predicted O-methyltransferase YrrM